MFGGQTSTTPKIFLGGSGNIFGSSSLPTTTTGLFQSPPQQPTGTSVKFEAIREKDYAQVKSGGSTVQKEITTRFQCINLMPYYQQKSLEELRLEDYQLQRHRQSTLLAQNQQPNPLSTGGTGLFGSLFTTSTPTLPPTATQPIGGLFSGTTSTNQTLGGTGILGQQSIFGQQANSNTNLFGGSNLFGSILNQSQQKQTTGLFGSPLTKTSTPALPSTQPLGGIFTGTTSTNQTLGGTGILGQQSIFGQQANNNTNLFGGSNLFGSIQSQQKQTTGLFGSPLTKTSTPALPSSQPLGGLFSGTTSTNQTVGGAGIFSQQSIFGQQANNNVNLLGGRNMFASMLNQSQQKQNAGWIGGFGSSGGSVTSVYLTPGPITFATTPFKDNKLFYNLPEVKVPKSSKKERKSMSPTERSRTEVSSLALSKRMKSAGAGPSWKPFYDISSYPAVKRLTCIAKGSKSNIAKFKPFDGFEEEDFGVGIDILSPKTDVKKLNLKSLEDSLSRISFAPDNDYEQTPVVSKGIVRQNVVSENGLENEKAEGSSGGKSLQLSQQRKRRVRFTLPSLSINGHEYSSPILFPGEDDDARNSRDYPRITLFSVGSNDDRRRNREDLTSSCDEDSERQNIPPGSLCGVINTRDGYYLKPPLEELDQKMDGDGNCIVAGLEIGRRNFGCVKYLCPVNIANVNIDKLVHFRHNEIVIYPDDNNKPELGQGLNVPAEIHLQRVWPIDRATNETIRNPDDPLCQNYEKRLQKSCERMRAKFMSYSFEEGIWIFRVGHF